MGDVDAQSLIPTQLDGSASILARLPEHPRHRSYLPSLASTWISIESWGFISNCGTVRTYGERGGTNAKQCNFRISVRITTSVVLLSGYEQYFRLLTAVLQLLPYYASLRLKIATFTLKLFLKLKEESNTFPWREKLLLTLRDT
ncbi:hypothetical protein KY290_010510 [Solanum tuberosum]|uniref:Uncharacterized protein n=1 Tax=Solanum tuberosum TaxID=4113 RepID=A0ABQ7VXZ6_SOLTU|nr:hypothetical protein KY284_010395 [Solanum tuberosum]KAH0773373.1 hypothetical protein KY290_010510 [Solanum tuberosum]